MFPSFKHTPQPSSQNMGEDGEPNLISVRAKISYWVPLSVCENTIIVVLLQRTAYVLKCLQRLCNTFQLHPDTEQLKKKKNKKKRCRTVMMHL